MHNRHCCEHIFRASTRILAVLAILLMALSAPNPTRAATSCWDRYKEISDRLDKSDASINEWYRKNWLMIDRRGKVGDAAKLSLNP